jgi:hypothetical protein
MVPRGGPIYLKLCPKCTKYRENQVNSADKGINIYNVRWVNHLNPNLNKKKWSTDEERIIFDAHKQYGNKWKKIAQLLENRSDNAIKNQFYSILRKGLRRVNKLLGDRKSTQMVKNIRTSVLSKLWKIE